MKTILIFLVLCNVQAYAQTEIRSSVGISNKAGLLNLSLGHAWINNLGMAHHLYYNQIIHLTRSSTVADIVGIRYGLSFRQYEANIGVDCHMLSNIKENDVNRGFHAAYGLSFKNEKWLYSAGKSGKIYLVTLGLFAIK